LMESSPLSLEGELSSAFWHVSWNFINSIQLRWLRWIKVN
jgi:hypothetical protein